MTLHERIAKALGWTVTQAQGFSLLTLRELVRGIDSQLAKDITAAVQSGNYIYRREP